ncbi:MAG: alpha-L-fucosidase [Bacteroidetes bacterium]|jgi:alpha-L-fucosidase|nr:alpha-L-fucosidase [Bacteroidota bacterium]MDF1867647.1 alpha-L-fucosidase [Saprospiraceae bacterium]
MKSSKKLLFFLIAFSFANIIFSQNEDSLTFHKKMEWFKDAKLGIFIHWGIYSVKGIDESWSFFNEYLSHEAYMKQLEGFNAIHYAPQKWAELIKKSGAKYSVITSKHHDGVALWNTKMNDLSTFKKTPAKQDVLSPFVAALKKEKLKVGIYYSLIDWSHPEYPNFTKTQKRYKTDSIKWLKFKQFFQGQLSELSEQYNPDLWWFDGDWEFSAEKWEAQKVRKMLLNKNPNTILNSRLKGYGDYATPEQGLPLTKPKSKYWELCMTMNDSWGYQHNDHNYKTPYEVIRIFADVIGNGGNLLLNIGPKADGTIPSEQIHILNELGKWTKKHEEAIFGSRTGIPKDYFLGTSTLSKNGEILYLFLPGKPNGQIMLKGIKNKINRIRIVGDGTKLSHKVTLHQYWSTKPGVVFIDVPESVVDEYMTVIAVQLKGKIDLGSRE